MKNIIKTAAAMVLASSLFLTGCGTQENATLENDYFICKYNDELLHIISNDDGDRFIVTDIKDDSPFKTLYWNELANKVTIERVVHHMSDPVNDINDEATIKDLSQKVLDADGELENETFKLEEQYVYYSANIANTNYNLEAKIQRTQDNKVTVIALQYADSDETYIKALKNCFEKSELLRCMKYNVYNKNEIITEDPTEEPTDKPTERPTLTPTEDPTEEPIDMSETLQYIRDNIDKNEYVFVTYDNLLRKPNEFKGTKVTYKGRVFQAQEDTSLDTVNMVALIISIDGDHNKNIYATYFVGKDEPRIIEGDYVQIYGTCDGLKTYESVSGKAITIPQIDAILVE